MIYKIHTHYIGKKKLVYTSTNLHFRRTVKNFVEDMSYFILFYSFYSILFYSILFYSILLYSILYYSILFYSILFYSILLYSILFYSILFYSILFYSILFYSTLFSSVLFYCILFYSIIFYSILFYSPRCLRVLFALRAEAKGITAWTLQIRQRYLGRAAYTAIVLCCTNTLLYTSTYLRMLI